MAHFSADKTGVRITFVIPNRAKHVSIKKIVDIFFSTISQKIFYAWFTSEFFIPMIYANC